MSIKTKASYILPAYTVSTTCLQLSMHLFDVWLWSDFRYPLLVMKEQRETGSRDGNGESN